AGPEEDARRAFKGAEPKESGATTTATVEAVDESPRTREGTDEVYVRLHPEQREALGAEPEDLVHVSVPGAWHGGLFSLQGRVAEGTSERAGAVVVPKPVLRAAGLEDGGDVQVRLLG
ncbi:MAG: hypothetical protein ABEL76_03230, partial [Bradymonadaceae bacterium]